MKEIIFEADSLSIKGRDTHQVVIGTKDENIHKAIIEFAHKISGCKSRIVYIDSSPVFKIYLDGFTLLIPYDKISYIRIERYLSE